MTVREELLLDAIRCAIRGKQTDWAGKCPPDEWDGLFELAYLHHLQPLLLEAVYACPDHLQLGEEKRRGYKRLVMTRCFGQIQRESEFLTLYREMTEAGFAPLVVKGLVCRRLYPKPSLRISTDEDLLVTREQFAPAAAFLESRGFRQPGPVKDPGIEFELDYARETGLFLELHCSLFAPGAAAMSQFNEALSGAHQNSMELMADGCPVRTLGAGDHMLYLLLHAFKHLIYSGFGLRQLCDILLWAETYGSQIDWNELLEVCRKLRCYPFVSALFQIGRDHLDFDWVKAGIPGSVLCEPRPTQALLEDLLSGGAYGGATMSRKHSATITTNAVEADRAGKKSSLLSSLFPSREDMAGSRPYLNRYPFLLPFAWGSRILHYGKELLKSEGGNTASESIRIGSARTELLRELDIIE